MSRLLTTTLALLAAALFGCSNTEPHVADGLDLSRFQGRWYEIARIPRDYDALCHDTTADYRLTAPGKLELAHSCRVGASSGPEQRFAAAAEVDDPAVPAKLSLQIGLYRGSYWVLEVGKNYEYAVIGHPSLTMLWVLSREPSLDPSTYQHALELARREGFSPNDLVLTPQSGTETP